MKKYLFILFLGMASCAFAQQSFFGVDAGINVANQRIVTSPNPSIFLYQLTGTFFLKNAAMPTFGIFYQHRFSNLFAIRVQGSYMGLGYNHQGSFGSDVSIDYLTFPVSIQYAANKHLSFGAGPYLSFTLGGTKINNEDITKTYHKNDFGFFVGGEHDLYKNFALGVKYFIGTKNIWLDDQNGTLKYTNRALQFTLIYKFKKTN
jgi:long-subunit fatty acid transport protein